ncbi:MAG: ECF transporter S component [Clostridiales bacterium]|nr:ECF transporter S component [Clostridiales bacterium]
MNKDKLISETVLIAVMSAAAAVGRIAFAALPYVKPTTAIVIITGLALGKKAGLLTGMFAALISNFYFGQGLWTPFQMAAWGIIGLLAGCMNKFDFDSKIGAVTAAAFGAVSAYAYGFMMNLFYIGFYIRPLTVASVLAALGASLLMDSVHAVSTVVFLLLLTRIWLRKLRRIQVKLINGDPA